MVFLIRDFELKDTKQLQYVAQTSWHHTYEGIIPRDIQEKFLAQAYSDDMLKKRMEQSLLYVVEIKDEIIGFANFFNNEDEAELSAIYLLPDYQGKGIGTALLEKGLAQLMPISSLFINVEKANQRGINFYQAKHFQVVSEFNDNFDGHVLETVRMVLKTS